MRFGAAKSLVFGFKLVENDAETKARSIERYVNNSGSEGAAQFKSDDFQFIITEAFELFTI